jgi:hypothetical protein
MIMVRGSLRRGTRRAPGGSGRGYGQLRGPRDLADRQAAEAKLIATDLLLRDGGAVRADGLLTTHRSHSMRKSATECSWSGGPVRSGRGRRAERRPTIP